MSLTRRGRLNVCRLGSETKTRRHSTWARWDDRSITERIRCSTSGLGCSSVCEKLLPAKTSIELVQIDWSRDAIAHHEAGHAVVARKVGNGGTPVSILLYSKVEDGKTLWGGLSDSRRAERPNNNDARHTLAGFFAQAKYTATKRHLGALFAKEQRWQEIAAAIQAEDTESPISLDFNVPESGSLVRVDLTNYEHISQAFHFMAYSDKYYLQLWISRGLEGASQSEIARQIKRAIEGCMTLLDETSTWRSVCSIAENLVTKHPIAAYLILEDEFGRYIEST